MKVILYGTILFKFEPVLSEQIVPYGSGSESKQI